MAMAGAEGARGRPSVERGVYEACRAAPEGADFLVASFVQALRSYRRPTVCAPFPLTLFNSGGELPDKDFSAAEDAVAHIPAMAAIVGGGAPRQGGGSSALSEGRSPLSDMPLRALRLLQWLLSFRCRVRLVLDPRELAALFPEEKSPWCIPGSGLSVSSSSIQLLEELRPHYVMEVYENCLDRRQEAFETAKVKGGSFMAFHGTAAENIHCILRCGLLNMSGTRLQRNGAIFGEGIYLSTDPAVAITFCSAGEGWERSSFGARARYMLLCEVANCPNGVTRSHSSLLERVFKAKEGVDDEQCPDLGTYVLVRNSDLVRVRYVFVYTEPSRSALREGARQPLCKQPVSREEFRRRVDWCKVLVFAYATLLLAVGFLNSETYRHGRLPAFLHSFKL